MLTQSEKKTVSWLIPVWIVILTIGTIIWHVFTTTEPFHTQPPRSAQSAQQFRIQDLGPPFTIAKPPTFEYIEIINGCSVDIDATCTKAYRQATTTSPVVTQLRIGTVLRVKDLHTIDGDLWYEIEFDEWLRYPLRLPNTFFVHGSDTRYIEDEGPKELQPNTNASTKRIVVDRTKQTLHAYDGDTLFMEQVISTGREITPTPRGIFTIFRKTPSRYMQGPIPGISPQYFDLPGVPWNLYFTEEGAVIHGAYCHN
jgi:hypothetical protein